MEAAPISFLVMDDRYASVALRGPWGRDGRAVLIPLTKITAEAERLIVSTAQAGVRWLIDSGVFELVSSHARVTSRSLAEVFGQPPMTIPGYTALLAKYHEVLGRIGHLVWGYVELDIGGAAVKKQTRTELERAGLRPIPVYHPLNDPHDYFDELARSYERICVGNMVGMEPQQRLRLLATIWERKRKYPHLWVHLLGYTPNQWLLAYPVDSTDTTAWMQTFRFRSASVRCSLSPFSYLPTAWRLQHGTPDEYMQALGVATTMAACDARIWAGYAALLREVVA